jgi:hypothetical protein
MPPCRTVPVPEAPTVVVNGKHCTLHSFTGKVVQSLKQKETVVTGAADLGQPSANIVTATTRDHHELMLKSDSGHERSFKTVDLDLPCRDGQTVSVVWVTVGGPETGAIVEMFNHTTGDRNVIDASRISFLFEKPMLVKVGIGFVVFLGGTLVLDLWWGVALALGAAVYGNWRALRGARALLASDAIRSLRADTAQRIAASERV